MMEKVYSCNLCCEKVKPEHLMGLRFHDLHTFTLVEARTTDGQHICMRCLNQLATQLAQKRRENWPSDSAGESL